MNSDLFAASIGSEAICRHCKNPKSSLKLYENPHLKKGLVESLSWQCTYATIVQFFILVKNVVRIEIQL